jgi:DNA topoisomerase-6 subunit B
MAVPPAAHFRTDTPSLFDEPGIAAAEPAGSRYHNIPEPAGSRYDTAEPPAMSKPRSEKPRKDRLETGPTARKSSAKGKGRAAEESMFTAEPEDGSVGEGASEGAERPVGDRSHESEPPAAEDASVAKSARSSGGRRSRPPKDRRKTAEALAAGQREISVSEFFAKNRHLLGFDNKRKALLTTVKEAVDNSLDACEEGGFLPEIHVEIDQLAEDRFRVRVRDNGPGIVKAQIPNIFGKLLYGSKFHRLKMSRGQQGIGISAAGMYGMLTTGKSVHITSRTGPKKEAHHFQIQIDTRKNRPDIIKDEPVEVEWDSGTDVTLELEASYAKGRQSVDEYLEQTAIANPHALILYKSPSGERREFPRVSQELPAETREIQPHPYGIELGVLMKMLKEARPTRKGERTPSLSGFLQNEFSRVTGRVAGAICQKAGLSPRARPNAIGTHEVEKLYQAMQAIKIMAPPTDCLAPIGVRSILDGLLKEVTAEFYTATTRPPTVYRGNPFAIEVGLAFGGTLPADSAARVIRFANRVPLLYQQSACCIFKAVADLDWRRYRLSQPSGSLPVAPLVVMVHMASVWVPFTSESKEAIADYDEIRKEVRLALLECGRKLQAYLNKRRKQRYEGERRGIFERYIAEVVAAVHTLKQDVDTDDLQSRLLEIARQRTARADEQINPDGKPLRQALVDPEDESTVVVEREQGPGDGLFTEE